MTMTHTKAILDSINKARLALFNKEKQTADWVERCTYPDCKCIVSTSSTQPEPICPKGLPQ